MIRIRRSEDRGYADHGWLKARHTFSFAGYHDPKFMGFRDLLVINEDRVAAGKGFGKHPHQDMEIVTYILEGELEHKDSMGSSSVIRPGRVQRMSAGRGVLHSEFNHSQTNPVHLLQIWITPGENGISPEYEEADFSVESRRNRLKLIVSPEGGDSSLHIHQDARIYAGILDAGVSVKHALQTGRHAWVQVARGSLQLNDQEITAGDGVAVSEENELKFKAGGSGTEVLLFDLP